MEATTAALKYRDYALETLVYRIGYDANQMVKACIKYLNFNLQNDQEIQDFICSVVFLFFFCFLNKFIG